MATQRRPAGTIIGLGIWLFLALTATGSPAPAATPDVRYEPTPHAVVQAILELADAGPDDILYDLGSGDGRIVIAAARDFGVRQATGVDIDPDRIRESRENTWKAGVTDQVQFVRADLFTYDFSDADVVTLYLLPRLNLKLRPRLLQELAPGTRIVSHSHDMGDWPPDNHVRIDGRDIYRWVIPARAGGIWTWRIDDRAYSLSLNQKYQKISGALTVGRRTAPLERVELYGDRLNFTVALAGSDDRIRFSGRVRGDEIRGELIRATETTAITAVRAGE